MAPQNETHQAQSSLGFHLSGKTPKAGMFGLQTDVIAKKARDANADNASARLIRGEARRIEKMHDALKSGGHDEKTTKALQANIEKARARIDAAKSEFEQKEMQRIRERAGERDKDERKVSDKHSDHVVKHDDHARKTDLATRNHNRDVAEGKEDVRKARDTGAGL